MNPKNVAIPDDILFEIFSNLDVPDLLKCEDVCGAWRTILRSRCLWKKLFERKVLRINDFPFNITISLLRRSVAVPVGGEFGIVSVTAT
jgi:F-box-like